jgi:hypothetical protein
MKTIDTTASSNITEFDRNFFDPAHRFRTIGGGELGGKAHGLAIADSILAARRPTFPPIDISIPSLTVLRTGVFDTFISRNDLAGVAESDESDESIARAFLHSELPTATLGDLRALVEQVRSPLAIRSSSLLEDAIAEPFAGVYETKMIPNSQPSADERFRRLVEAIKFVYASTFFREAREYRAATRHHARDEKMAVIIQEVVGNRFNDRFYPNVSGVARSFNYYPMGAARPADGVVSLALGLGKTIVDGDLAWTYSPAFPANPPPFASSSEILKQTQTRFWAINMGKPPEYDPTRETEYLLHESLEEAELDGTLARIASTFDRESGRIRMGIGTDGPRVLDFAMPLVLRDPPVNDVIRSLMRMCEEEIGDPVEIEFAMTFEPHRFGFLQVRPMMVSAETVVVDEADLCGPGVLAASDRVLGNGTVDSIRDVVYVRPDRFEAKHSRRVAAELNDFNRQLLARGRPYLLVGFGRWGSADPWLGIPVKWGQISGARVIIEAMQTGMNVEPSQGSHFFHNLAGFRVPYFSMPYSGRFAVDWEWLNGQTVERETELLRHVSLEQPLAVRVDGRSGRGVIFESSR